jgi:hypothetical protein
MATKKTERFEWLTASCIWGGGKATLETGKIYEAALFPEDVVAGWVRDGAAKWATTAKER